MTIRWAAGPIVVGVCLVAAADLRGADRVTFAGNIAPILYQNCVTCHRPGEAAPFSLISYEDAKKRGSLMAAVTKSGYMPPWHAAHGYGEFAGERRLTAEQISAIGEWVKQGMPEGDKSKMPKLPEFSSGWHLGEPDLVLEMPKGYDVPASGPDQFRNFVIPTKLGDDKWVRAVEFRPSARNVVHHAIFSWAKGGVLTARDGADGKPGYPGVAPVGIQGATGSGIAESGSLGGWATGATPAFLPEGLSMRLPKGSDFILQIHFHPTGKAETEKSLVGFYFADHAPEHNLIEIGTPTLFSFGKTLDIAPGSKDFAVEESVVLPVDVRAYTVAAHAHYLGKEMKATATLPDGTTKPLLWIQDWDFNWQDAYTYKDPFDLPKGTRIDVRVRWDNSEDNPRNPKNPPRRVRWGIQSQDEMGGIAVSVVTKNKEDEKTLRDFLGTQVQAAGLEGFRNGNLARLNQVQRIAQSPSQRLTFVDRKGEGAGTTGDPGLYSQPAFSPDGARVAAALTDRESGISHIWIYNSTGGPGKALTSGDASDTSPVWSPDGKQIAWVRNDADAYAIYRRAADGSGQPELIYKHTTGAALFLTDWSSNDLLCLWTGESKSLYMLPLKGDRKPIDLFPGRGGRVSPDGRLIAFSLDEGGSNHTFVRELNLSNPKTPAIRVHNDTSLGGGVWRADGRALLFTSLQGLLVSGLWQVEITESPELTVGAPELLFKPKGIGGPAQLSSFATADLNRFATIMPVR